MDPVIFDGRNLFDPALLRTLGMTYYAIGRGNGGANSDLPYGRRKTDMVAAPSRSTRCSR